MPDAAEVDALVRLLDDRQHQRAFGQALDQRVLGRLAEALGQRQELLRRKLLIAKKDHDMLEQGDAQLLDRVVVERLGEIDAEDLGAERAGERSDLQTGPGHQRHGRSPLAGACVEL